jgi:hypothetical protein
MVNYNELLSGRITASMEESRRMYDGDLWLNSKGLAVRMPTDNAKLTEVKNGFATQNVVEEIVDRRRDGILGREPIWQMVTKSGQDLTDGQKQAIEETVAAVVEWWNKREMLSQMKEVLVGAFLERRAELRPFVPKVAYDANGGLKNVSSVADALDLLHFQIISPKSAGVFLEDDSLKPYSVYEYTKADERIIEVSLTDADGKTHLQKLKEQVVSTFITNNFSNSLAKYTDMTWYQKVLEAAKKLVNKDAMSDEFNYEPLDLDGKLFLFEMDLKRPFISDPMKSLQKQISLDKTMQGRNTYTAGFRSKHWLNARPPTASTKIADASQPSGYRTETINLPMKDGAGVNGFVQGTLIRNDAGEVIGVATPNVVITDPVSVQTFIESKDDNRAGILAMADQLHILLSDSATASGFSRQQARAEFQKSLNDIKPNVDALGRWIVEFAIMFAANLTNKVEMMKQFRVDFNSIVDAGVLSPEEKDDNRKAYQAGEISLETLQSRNGVEDTDAELQKIKSEDGFEINRLEKVLTVLEKANGKLPKKMQIEFLIKTLGKEEEWQIESIMSELEKETPKPTVPTNGLPVKV